MSNNASLTWLIFQVTELSNIDMFEDPVYSTYVSKDLFIEMYRPVLETLDGRDMSSFIDFYFESSPINRSIYLFRDENAKLDFRDFAIELGIIPELKEIMEGENTNDKKKRLTKATSKSFQNKKHVPVERKVQHKSNQSKITLDNLMAKLKDENDPILRANIEKKIQNTLRHIDTSV